MKKYVFSLLALVCLGACRPASTEEGTGQASQAETVNSESSSLVKEASSQLSESKGAPKASQKAAELESYETVLADWRQALEAGEAKPGIDSHQIQVDPQVMSYTLYDINQDGRSELLIYNHDQENLIQIYSLAGDQAQALFDDPSIGYRSQLSLLQNGEILQEGSGGAMDHVIQLFALDDQSSQLDELGEMRIKKMEDDSDKVVAQEGRLSPEVYEQSKGQIIDLSRLDFKPLMASGQGQEAQEETSGSADYPYAVDAEDLAGTYIRGNGFLINGGMGRMTIYPDQNLLVFHQTAVDGRKQESRFRIRIDQVPTQTIQTFREGQSWDDLAEIKVNTAIYLEEFLGGDEAHADKETSYNGDTFYAYRRKTGQLAVSNPNYYVESPYKTSDIYLEYTEE
ncbi:hypothetical protein ACX3VT_00780 [Aerococcus sanguinicola]|uniref:hypothetical protein n=1 Tax=unclassified Aerococcus TaxID=2618060 RepID=UPI0008A2FE46|nr:MULTISPECIES: hypothetical protein [unclassified Aerococcus]KAB0646241.1 hypothetical protein F6I01_08045 [Aerococcus sanguinicola]MDK6234067.1 hypothetical protein [Aerococcus sp. UMB10185]MDK6856610.1 hypothetical protein [Aerococcus sp. UMB7533]MDK8503101.1 hypothetical protein [Aerococcus sp. UMB1112A]OFN01107.1 hypothetical protein HMPREF2626_02970 [Aerococcus sp. HMSC062A02]